MTSINCQLFELKHQEWPGGASSKKTTSKHTWQTEKELVISSRPLLFFIVISIP